MHLMMAFNSSYVVRAYRCLTFRRVTGLAPGESSTYEASIGGSLDSNGRVPGMSSFPPNVANMSGGGGGSGGQRPKSASFERSNMGSSNSNNAVCVVKPGAIGGKSTDAAGSSGLPRTASGSVTGSAGGNSYGVCTYFAAFCAQRRSRVRL